MRWPHAAAALLLLACLLARTSCTSDSGVVPAGVLDDAQPSAQPTAPTAVAAQSAQSAQQPGSAERQAEPAAEQPAEPAYRRHRGDYEPRRWLGDGETSPGDGLDDTWWYVPSEYLKAYEYINGLVVPVLDQTVWHLRTSRSNDGYISGTSVASLFPADPPAGFQFSFACNRMLGSITPSRSVYISFIPADNANGTAVTTGLGTFGKFKGAGGWAFEMQMGSGSPQLLAAHWAYMLECKRGQPCWDSLPGVGMSVPDFMAQCGW